MKKVFNLLLIMFLCVVSTIFFAACDKISLEIESIDGYEIEGNTVIGTVSNDTESVMFDDKVVVAKDISWKLCVDVDGKNEITSKVASLDVGDNVFYIIIANKKGENRIYSLLIRRRPMYTVSFNTNGGSEIECQEIEEGFIASIPNLTPTKEGYTFSSWNFDFTNKIIGNTVIDAIYVPNTYEIIYKLNNGSTDIQQEVVYGQSVQIKNRNNTYRAGYLFDHWDYEYKGNNYQTVGLENINWNFTSDIVFNAVWNVVDYTISYTLNGGVCEETINSYNIETETFDLPTARKGGYTFIGWFDNAEFNGDAVNEVYKGEFGNKNLYAKFELIFLCTPIDDTTAYIRGLTDHGKTLSEIEIPNIINYFSHDYTITQIRSAAFKDCTNLQSLIIPESVVSIGGSAFSGCTNLQSINIPSKIKEINDYTFAHCESLTEIIIPEGVTRIGRETFSGCSSLVNVMVPSSIIDVDNYAFNNCNSIVCNSYDNANYIGSLDNPYLVLMKAVNKDITSCEIHNETKIIYDEAFRDCKLVSIIIPNNVLQIGCGAIQQCFDLKTVILNDALVNIKGFAFMGCNKLEEIVIPNNVLFVGDYAFYGCSKLESIVIGSHVESIGDSAFKDCVKIASITIPDSVTHLGQDVFKGCSGVTSFVIGNGITFIDKSMVPSSLQISTLVIGNSVTEIGNWTFSSFKITEVFIPASVKRIRMGAFYTTSLESATFEVKAGWKVDVYGSLTDINIDDDGVAAMYLKDTYYLHDWILE